MYLYNARLMHVRITIVTAEKQYGRCEVSCMCAFSVLVTQHAKCMRRVRLQSAACLTVPYFVTSFHNRYGFRKNVTEHKMCVLSFYTTFAWNISHTKRNSMRYH